MRAVGAAGGFVLTGVLHLEEVPIRLILSKPAGPLPSARYLSAGLSFHCAESVE